MSTIKDDDMPGSAADSEAEAAAEADFEGEAEADFETDSEADFEAEADSEADFEAEADSEAEAETGAGLLDAMDHPLHAVAGTLASSVAGQLARPLRELREMLAVTVETLDRYIGDAEGPRSYPWKSLQSLRQEIAGAYLLSRENARLASELYEALNVHASVMEAIDANRQIEAALELVRHRVSDHTELFVDLGSIPPVHAGAGELTLAVAKMLLACAESASAREGSAISVKTRFDREANIVVIYVADNGCGLPAAARSAERAIAPVMSRLGGSFAGVSEPGEGSVYECHFPVRH